MAGTLTRAGTGSDDWFGEEIDWPVALASAGTGRLDRSSTGPALLSSIDWPLFGTPVARVLGKIVKSIAKRAASPRKIANLERGRMRENTRSKCGVQRKENVFIERSSTDAPRR